MRYFHFSLILSYILILGGAFILNGPKGLGAAALGIGIFILFCEAVRGLVKWMDETI